MKEYSKTFINKGKNTRGKTTIKNHSSETAAWSESYKVIPESNVTIPSIENVIDAKEWVDDGSKL